MILKATELGLATLIMGIRDEKKIREMLNIPTEEIIVAVIALGIGDTFCNSFFMHFFCNF